MGIATAPGRAAAADTVPHRWDYMCLFAAVRRDTLSLSVMNRIHMHFGNLVTKKDPEIRLQLF